MRVTDLACCQAWGCVRCGVGDNDDNCPADPNANQSDVDGDGVGDACDGCPNDPLKIAPGFCGCGVEDADADGDGTPDCLDGAFDVPEDFATIQDAIDAAPENAIINVSAGTRSITETIDLLGKSLTLRGAIGTDNRPATVLDGGGAVRVLICNSGEGAGTRIENLAIINGFAASGGGMEINNAALTNAITTNMAAAAAAQRTVSAEAATVAVADWRLTGCDGWYGDRLPADTGWRRWTMDSDWHHHYQN